MLLSSKRAFGIDISDYSIEVLEFEKRGEAVELVRHGRQLIEAGTFTDGKIIEQEKLAHLINFTLQESLPSPITIKHVVASLPESRTYMHTFSLPPGLRDDEYRALVEEEVFKALPLAKEEVYYDFFDAGGGEKGKEILFAACPRGLVDSYVSLFTSAGLELVALDIESASIARALMHTHENKSPTLIIDIGARVANFLIIEGNGIRLSASLPVAGHHLTESLASGLKIEREKAEHFKKTIGLDPAKEGGRVMLLLQKTLQAVLEETKKIISFYEQERKKEVKSVFLVGGTSLLPNLISYLSSNLGLEVRIFDPWEGISVEHPLVKDELQEPSGRKAHSVFFTNAVGLALRGVGEKPEKNGINLLPGELEKS